MDRAWPRQLRTRPYWLGRISREALSLGPRLDARERTGDHGQILGARFHSSNGRIAYADVEAVRVVEELQTWARHLDTLWC
jgi:hypothetical protein